MRIVVAIAAIVSSAAYFFCSRAVRAEVANGTYRTALWHSFLTGPHAPVIEPLHIDSGGVLGFVALLIATINGILLRRALHSQSRDVGPEVLTYALGSIVVPPLLIATVFWPDGRGFITTPILLGSEAAIMLVLLTAAALVAGRMSGDRIAAIATPPRDPRPATASSTSADRAWACAFVAIAIAYLAGLTVVALNSLRGFDSLAYHLPLAASWLHHSSLTTNVEASATFFFPANGELLLRWALVCGDQLAFVPAYAESIGCLYVIYKIAREIGQPRATALIAATAALSCVLVSFIATSAYIDAFLTLASLLSVLFLIRAIRQQDRASIVAFGTALGLAAGSKYSALQPAVAMCAIWLWHVARRNVRAYEGCFRVFDWRAIGREFVSLAIPAILCSAYWYVRNLIEHGNPLFPFGILGMRGLPMDALIYVRPEVAQVADWLAYPWREMASQSFDDYIGGVFGGVALIGVVAAATRVRRNRDRDLVLLVLIASFVLWLSTGTFVPRYGLFPLLLSFVFLGDVWLERRSAILSVTTFVVFIATLFIFGRGLATQTVYVTMTHRPRYGVPRVVDQLPSATILNATSSMANYYLMGRDYRHDVITTFAKSQPADVARFCPQYVLVSDADASRFQAAAPLQLVAHSDADDLNKDGLYRVRSSAPRRR